MALRAVAQAAAVASTGSTEAWVLVTSTGGAHASQATGVTWEHAGDVASVSVTGLAGATDLLVIGRAITASAQGARCIQVSVDNGSSFYEVSGDYVIANGAGAETAVVCGFMHTTNSTAARSGGIRIANFNGTAPVRVLQTVADSSGTTLFLASASPLTAVRLINIASGVAAGNLTAGTLYVYARR